MHKIFYLAKKATKTLEDRCINSLTHRA